MNKEFWQGKKIFLPGHSGFKGRWLKLWLESMGAEVRGYSLTKDTLSNSRKLLTIFSCNDFDIAIHMAAQSLVKIGYEKPRKTFEANAQGTANFLDACRLNPPKAILIVTSDKVYKHHDHLNRETDELGSNCPYSSSKMCAEIIAKTYTENYNLKIATVRAGNVIGGGDFNEYRLIPDIIKAIESKKKVKIRNISAIRPWFHVLDCLNGYLTITEKLYGDSKYQGSWNFGPDIGKERTVSHLINEIKKHLDFEIEAETSGFFKESPTMLIDSYKSKMMLNWKPKFTFDESIKWTAKWYTKYLNGENMEKYTLEQINEFSTC